VSERRGSSSARGRDHGFPTITVVKILAGKGAGIKPRVGAAGPALLRPVRRGGKTSPISGVAGSALGSLPACGKRPFGVPGLPGSGLDELADHPPHRLGRRHVLGGWAILGLPPFATFVSELLILLAAFDRAPLLALVLAAALLVAFAAIAGRLQGMLWGSSGKSRRAERALPLVPAFVSLALVLVLGVAFPPPFAAWSQATIPLLGLRP